MIDPASVIQQRTVEELNETAEEYYRRVDDPTPLMSKPFAFLHETPEMLQNLGLLLSGMHLGRTMTVLDFGAGTCWLSRCLSQLNCQVTCCDVSKTALEIGRRLYAENPLIGTAVFKPRFLPFDGHHIDLPDQSVDRIICFDAFHHVPNQQEVIREFGRVLKQGGIAGFSEPGRHHAETPQSQYEMRNHKVLENNIDVDAIFALAEPAGFTRLSVKVVTDMEMSLAEHNLLFGEGNKDPLKADVWNQTFNTMHNRAIFFLHKGPLVRDSRGHIGLEHQITIEPADYTIGASEPLRLEVTVVNTGDARWLHANSEIFGIVRVASHLYDDAGTTIEVDHSRHGLPRDVAPGETLRLPIEIPLPGPGKYRLAIDLVAEGVTWFENRGSKPVHLLVTQTA